MDRGAWDDASRLVSWSRGAESAAYTCDAAGQRTSATVTAGGTTMTTTYTYDGLTLLSLDAERSDETTYAVAYLYGEDARPYAGVYASSETTVPVTFLIATTDRGDVVALTNTAGAVFARYTYDPYGAVLSQDANAVTGITPDVADAIAARQPLRYAGYTYDAHSATYYLSQRHYDPATMRFLTKDPARDDGEESAYQYCAGDPVGRVDPSGEAAPYHANGVYGLKANPKIFGPKSGEVTGKYDRDNWAIILTLTVTTWNDSCYCHTLVPHVLKATVKARVEDASKKGSGVNFRVRVKNKKGSWLVHQGSKWRSAYQKDTVSYFPTRNYSYPERVDLEYRISSSNAWSRLLTVDRK